MIFVSNQLSSKATRVEHDGRTYLVAPVVAIRAGVLNDELVMGAEIGRYPESWNGIPVPLGHPTLRGSPISANSPEIEASLVVGRFWNAKWDGERLRGEIWLDIEKAERMGGDALEALQRIERGDSVEVSTAYFRDIEERGGEVNGERFTGIARNLRPDHLALLLHSIGACSWMDGCGTPRVNEEMKMAVNQNHTGIMVALFPPEAEAQALALSGEGLPEGSVVTPANELHLTLVYLGEVGQIGFGQGDLLKWVMHFAQENPIIRGMVSGVGRFNTADAEGRQAIYASYDSLMLAPFRFWLADRLPYGPENHGFTPHITIAYVPADAPMPNILPAAREIVFDRIGVAWGDQVTLFQLQGEAAVAMAGNSKPTAGASAYIKNAFRALAKAVGFRVAEELPQANHSTPNDAGQVDEEGVMEKKQLIETLVANARCPFSAAELETMSESALAKVEKAVEAGGCTGEPPATNASAPQVPQGQVLEAEMDAEVKSVLGELQGLAAAIKEIGGVEAVKSALATHAAIQQAHKAELVSELKANERCAFDEVELKAMPEAQLEKLATSLRPANYAGRGGVRSNGAQDDRVPQPPAVLLGEQSQAA